MSGRIPYIIIPVTGILLLACGLHPAAATDLNPAQLRGKQIYTQGAGPGGKSIRVRIAGDVLLPATGYPCVQCHGVEGKGGFEGGVKIPEIQWQRLSSPHGVPTLLGGTRPAYNRETFARAVREGIASSGTKLDPLMPRYSMEEADLDDLFAYLKVIGEETPPGVEQNLIRIGTISSAGTPGGRAATEILRRYFKRINERGGIHGRRLELVSIDATPDINQTKNFIGNALNEGGILAFVANGGPGAAPEVLRYLEEKKVPVIGPLTFARGAPGQGSVFYLLSSLEDQGRAAARYLKDLQPELPGQIAVVTGSGPGSGEQAMLKGLAAEAEKIGLHIAVRQSWKEEGLPEMVLSLRDRNIDMIVLLGNQRLARRLLVQSQKYNWRPKMMASTVLLGQSLSTFTDLFLVMPAVAPAATGEGDGEFRALLHEKNGNGPAFLLDRGNRAMEMVAFAAGKVLVRALTDAGRDIHLRGFLSSLRGIKNFHTGVMPPVGYGPNRRVGVRGALIAVTASSRRKYETEWVDVSQ